MYILRGELPQRVYTSVAFGHSIQPSRENRATDGREILHEREGDEINTKIDIFIGLGVVDVK